jgi:hypothetical protein
VTWWLAQSIGGPVAGLVAGLAMAVSTSAVQESTFIWNPNLIALSSAVALAGAWHAWRTRQPRWWLLAALGTAVTMQCHVLGITMLPIVGALLVADGRARSSDEERRRVWWFGLSGLAIIGLSFLPLVIHEVTSDFSEVHAALDYIRSGGDPTTLGPPARFLVIGGRVLSWPLAGLLTDAPAAALLAAIAVIGIALWRSLAGAGAERLAARWLGLGLVWTSFALTFISPSLATVVPGLPNDHYHAFADPMAFTLVGLGAAGLWQLVPARRTGPGGADRAARLLGPAIVVVAVTGLVVWNLARQPAAVHPDGGFPAAERAAAKIIDAAGRGSLTLRSIPDFKSTEAYAYPLIRAGALVNADGGTGPVVATDGPLVLVCDSLFEKVTGAACGGPAEAAVAPPDHFGEPILRFEAAPGRTISIYAPSH